MARFQFSLRAAKARLTVIRSGTSRERSGTKSSTRLSALVLVAWLLSTPWLDPLRALPMQTPRLTPIPSVSLEAMEPAVRRQLEQQQQALENLGVDGGDAETRPSSLQLATAYGELGQLYLLYDLAGPARAALTNAAALAPDAVRWPYLLGTSYEVDADRATAATHYEDALLRAERDHPRPAARSALKVRLARVLSQQGYADRATKLYREVEDVPDFRAAAREGEGLLAAERGDHQRAIELFSEALAAQPSANQLHYQLGLSHRELGNLDQARYHLENRGDRTVSFPDPIAATVQTKAGGAGALLTLGRMSVATGELEVALERFLRAADIAPENPEVYRSLGALQLRRGDLVAASAAFERAIELAPDDARLRFLAAQLLLDRSVVEEDHDQRAQALQSATEHLGQVLLLAPTFEEARAALASVQLRLGRFEAADATYREALELDPGQVEWHYRRAVAVADRIAAQAGIAGAPVERWGSLGRSALSTFLDGLAAKGQALSEGTALEVGLLELRLGASNAGRKRLGDLVSGGSASREVAARASLYLANEAAQRAAQKGAQRAVLGAQGRSEEDAAALDREALERYQRAVQLDPNLVEARFNLATLLGRMRRFGEAALNYAEVIGRDASNSTVRVSHAMALLLDERDAEARAALEAALEVMPEESILANLLARIMVASNDAEVRAPDVGLDLALRLFEALPTAQHAETVAMALAENQQFDQAVKWQSQVLEDLEGRATENRSTPEIATAKRRLDQYQALNPERSPWRLAQ